MNLIKNTLVSWLMRRYGVFYIIENEELKVTIKALQKDLLETKKEIDLRNEQHFIQAQRVKHWRDKYYNLDSKYSLIINSKYGYKGDKLQ